MRNFRQSHTPQTSQNSPLIIKTSQPVTLYFTVFLNVSMLYRELLDALVRLIAATDGPLTSLPKFVEFPGENVI